MITIKNDGQTITETTYWATPHADKGLLYLSINAGALRLLVPAASAQLLSELPPVGTPCELTRSRLQGEEAYRLAWLDDPEEPYEVEIDVRQCDRRLASAENGRILTLICYTRGVGDGVREARREQIQIGREVAS